MGNLNTLLNFNKTEHNKNTIFTKTKNKVKKDLFAALFDKELDPKVSKTHSKHLKDFSKLKNHSDKQLPLILPSKSKFHSKKSENLAFKSSQNKKNIHLKEKTFPKSFIKDETPETNPDKTQDISTTNKEIDKKQKLDIKTYKQSEKNSPDIEINFAFDKKIEINNPEEKNETKKTLNKNKTQLIETSKKENQVLFNNLKFKNTVQQHTEIKPKVNIKPENQTLSLNTKTEKKLTNSPKISHIESKPVKSDFINLSNIHFKKAKNDKKENVAFINSEIKGNELIQNKEKKLNSHFENQKIESKTINTSYLEKTNILKSENIKIKKKILNKEEQAIFNNINISNKKQVKQQKQIKSKNIIFNWQNEKITKNDEIQNSKTIEQKNQIQENPIFTKNDLKNEISNHTNIKKFKIKIGQSTKKDFKEVKVLDKENKETKENEIITINHWERQKNLKFKKQNSKDIKTENISLNKKEEHIQKNEKEDREIDKSNFEIFEFKFEKEERPREIAKDTGKLNSSDTKSNIQNITSNSFQNNSSSPENHNQNDSYTESYEPHQEKFNEDNRLKNNFNLNLKIDELNIKANLRNQVLNLVINSNSYMFTGSTLTNEIRTILLENGFKNFNLTIKEKGKKIFEESSVESNFPEIEHKSFGRREINVRA